jgi:menaquinone-specific isochorismate synthase
MTRVVSLPLPEAMGRDLLELLPADSSVFVRGGQGLVGWGEAKRITASGPNRIADLNSAWKSYVTELEVVDSVSLPGSGPVAFGTIAFADESAAESVLIMPRVVIGRRDDRFWITTVDDAKLPAATVWQKNPAITLSSGSLGRQNFSDLVDRAVAMIQSERLEKVVLARDLVGEVPANFDLRSALGRLANRFPSCWIYSVDRMFGASPELLVRVSHSQVSARVLAGTAARGTDPSVDQAISKALAESHKNLAEHDFAVKSLVSALEPFCDHVDADTEPFSLALPNLWHLASDVHGVLKQDSSVLDLASALHPTAAVAGTPRDAAQALIAELEPFDRGRYAGPVGWIGADGDGEWVIALRGAQVSEGKVTAYAGCGIVSESDGESELIETDLKFLPIIGSLA